MELDQKGSKLQRVQRGNPRRISTSVRWTVDEYLRVKKQARKAHMTITDYIKVKVGEGRLSHWPLRGDL